MRVWKTVVAAVGNCCPYPWWLREVGLVVAHSPHPLLCLYLWTKYKGPSANLCILRLLTYICITTLKFVECLLCPTYAIVWGIVNTEAKLTSWCSTPMPLIPPKITESVAAHFPPISIICEGVRCLQPHSSSWSLRGQRSLPPNSLYGGWWWVSPTCLLC